MIHKVRNGNWKAIQIYTDTYNIHLYIYIYELNEKWGYENQSPLGDGSDPVTRENLNPVPTDDQLTQRRRGSAGGQWSEVLYDDRLRLVVLCSLTPMHALNFRFVHQQPTFEFPLRTLWMSPLWIRVLKWTKNPSHFKRIWIL